MKVRVVGFGGTMGEASSSLQALRCTLSAAGAAGAETQLIEARTLALPMFGGEAPSVAARSFADTMHAADAIVLASPLYHGSVSGLFKNALDWLELLRDHKPPYLTDKPVGLIAVAGGSQSLAAISTMENVVRALRGWPVPLVVPIDRSARVFDAEGNLTDPGIEARLELLGVELVRVARLFAAGTR